MQKWYHIFYKSTGLSPYIWVVFCILPLYFILRLPSVAEVVTGIVLVLVFFGCYVLAFLSRGWLIYLWSGLQIVVSITMTVMFGYVYFALFLAFFIGNIQNRIGFATLYTIHLITSIGFINYGFVIQNPMMISQLPFVLISLIGVVLLPVTTYNRNKRDKLEGQLEHANKRLAELAKMEERQRIARDLHDTLGQKLSLIGLKSDLAAKLIQKQPERAREEIDDVRQTARTALKEVRELVTEMRGARLEDELFRVKQILKAADIELVVEGEADVSSMSLIAENVLAMCLKEAVTNVVRHSEASTCRIGLIQSPTEFVMRICDDGVGWMGRETAAVGNGLRGMRERLEFVNGVLEIDSEAGVSLKFRLPIVPIQS